MGVQCEGVQRATAKPSGRLRRGEISLQQKDQHRETTSPDAGRSRPSGATMCKWLIKRLGGAPAGATRGLCGRPLDCFACPSGCYLILIGSFFVSVLFVLSSNIKIQEIGVCTAKGWRGRPQSPLLASAEAKFLQHNRIVREERTFPSTTKRAKQSPVSPILSCETADYLTSSISREQATKIAAAILVPSASFASALLALCLSK